MKQPWWICAGCALGLVGTTQGSELRMEPANVMLQADVIASGLNGPAGLCVQGGDVYVAERGAHRLTRVRNKQVLPILPNGFEVSEDLPDWALSVGKPRAEWVQPILRDPAGIAVGPDGALYVAEAGEKARVLRFDTPTDDVPMAVVVSTPWTQGEYSYTGIRMDDHGRLYLSVRKSTEKTALPYGSVMKREIDGGWWMVDYGPFADFGPPMGDPGSEFIVVAEKRSADVCWYDSSMQVCIGAMEALDGIRHVALLPDGVTLGVMEQESGSWSLVELDPQEARIREWIGDLGPIGGMCTDPGNGDVYLSLATDGKILRLSRMHEDAQPDEHHLRAMRRTFREEHSLPPAQWPEFFRAFVERLEVVEPINQRHEANDEERKSLTLGEFAEAVPLVAAKVRAELLSPAELEPDPIEEVSFVLFYPNQSTLTQGTLAPSLSLFCAVRKSGRRSVSRFLVGGTDAVRPDTPWSDMPDVLMPSPLGSQIMAGPLTDRDALRVNYVGMFGNEPNYWIEIDRDDPAHGRMKVSVKRPFEDPDTGRRSLRDVQIAYRLEPLPESPDAGGRTVLVADNMIPKAGWYEVNDYPVMWNIVVSEPEALNLRHTVRLEELQAYDVRVDTVKADEFLHSVVRSDIAWRREVIKQSMVRWGTAHF